MSRSSFCYCVSSLRTDTRIIVVTSKVRHTHITENLHSLIVRLCQLWNTFHAPEHVAQIARYQLKLWGIDYFDLFLIHFPVSLKYVDPAERYPPEWWGDTEKTHVNLGMPIPLLLINPPQLKFLR